MWLKANNALNSFKGMYKDATDTLKHDLPWTYSVRNKAGRDAADAHLTSNKGSMEGFKFDEGTISKKRLAGMGLAGYAAFDAGSRAINGGSLTRNSSGQSDLVGVPLF